MKNERICVLGMSKLYGRLCIVGINEAGKWVRPITGTKAEPRHWQPSELTFGGEILKVGNTISFAGDFVADKASSLHNENFLTKKIKLEDERDLLFNGDYEQFVLAPADFRSLCRGEAGGSLGIIVVNKIKIFKNSFDRLKVSMETPEINNVMTKKGEFPFRSYPQYKDYTSSLKTDEAVTVTSKYVTIELSGPFNYKALSALICYPQIVGVT